MTVRLSEHVEAPVEQVFAFFRDPGNWQDAGRGVTFRDVHLTRGGTGTHYTWHTRVAGVPVEGFDVFTEFIPNQRITDRSSSSLEGTWTYAFAAEGTGTRLTLQNRVGWPWRLPLLERLVDVLAAAGHRHVLAGVKARLESAAPLPGPGDDGAGRGRVEPAGRCTSRDQWTPTTETAPSRNGR